MGKNKSIRIGQNENRSIKKVLEEIENKAIESQYTKVIIYLSKYNTKGLKIYGG